MAFAETAQLAVELKLKDQLSGGLTQANAKVKELEATAAGATTRGVGGLSTGMSKAGGVAATFGGKISQAGSRVKDFAFGPLGLIGVTGGLLTFGGAIEQGVKKAQEFGAEVQKMAAVTGLSIETTSALSAALDHYGVSSDKALRLTGFLEKNIGNLAARKDGIAGFEKSFSLALTDTNGKLKDANELILTTADYFNNKSIPATTKAAALSKLYGRSWQDMIPFLKAGRQGIADAEEQAAKMGLTLKASDIPNLVAMKKATRDWGDALGGLELQIGLALIPSLTELAKTATSFVSQNRDQIVGFFKNAAKFAGELGDVVRKDVVPVFKGIADAWGALPQGLKDLLITGLVAGKVSKILFDFGPLDFAKLGAGLFSGLGKSLFQRGGSPATPLFVADVTGGLGGAGGAAGEVSKLVSAAKFVVPMVIGAAAVWEGYLAILGSKVGNQGAGGGKTGVNNQGQTLTPAQQGAQFSPNRTGGVSTVTLGEHALDKIVDAANAANMQIGMGIQEGHRDTDKLEGTTVASASRIAAQVLGLRQDNAAQYAKRKSLFAEEAKILGKEMQIAFLGKGTGKDQLTVAQALAEKFAHSQAPFYRDSHNSARALAELEGLQKRFLAEGDRKSAAAIGHDIATMKQALGQKSDRLIDRARAIERSTESQKQKLIDLKSLQARAIAHGDHAASRIIAKLIAINNSVAHFNARTGRVDVTVTTTDAHGVHHTTTTQTGPNRQAAGGPFPEGYGIVGEQGIELLDFKRRMVIPTMRSANYLTEFLHRAIGQTRLWQPSAQRSRYGEPVRVSVTLNTSARSNERAQIIALRYGPQVAQ